MTTFNSLALTVLIAISGCTTDNPGVDDDAGVTDDAGGDDLASGPDLSNTCTGSETRACYSGAAGTSGVGLCHDGTQTCVNGMFGPCMGEVAPSPESCNNLDDDCNNSTDDNLGMVSCGIGACKNTVAACTTGKPTNCVPLAAAGAETCGNNIDDDCNGLVDDGCACTYVAPAPLGNDATGTGTALTPFRTIGKGIASAGSNGLPRIVCVAAGVTCPGAPFDYPEGLSMRDGVSVYGGYQATGTTWPRNAACVTRIVDQSAVGVLFDKTVTSQTALAGFTIVAQVAASSAAITVSGSTGAVISDDVVTGSGTMTSYGIDIGDNGGTAAKPLIQRSSITGGNGTALSIGVHVLNSAPTLQGNCDTIDAATGRCLTNGCFGNGGPPTRFIRGRGPAGNGTETYAVRLESSPGTIVEQSSLCAFGASGDQAAVRISGAATGVLIHANHLFAIGDSKNSVGMWADSCGGASPWVLFNTQVDGSSNLSGGRADGVRAIGDCPVRVDSNVLVVGGIEAAQAAANGVLCANDPTTKAPNRCTVLGNVEVRGAGSGFPPVATGVDCEPGSCARIENNALITARSGMRTFGVRLRSSGTFVNANRIDAGCAMTEGIGLAAEDAFARVQNNAISGSICPNANTAPSYAVRVYRAAGANEIDLNSNDLFGAGGQACTSRGLAFDVLAGAAPPTAPLGIVRNNIVLAGNCATRYAIEEQSAASDPRLLENNDLFSTGGAPTALYRDEAMTDLTMLTQVNALMGAAANISADPMFTAGMHIPAGSPCTNTGTASGAPAKDFEGDTRPQQSQVDIGWDEFKP